MKFTGYFGLFHMFNLAREAGAKFPFIPTIIRRKQDMHAKSVRAAKKEKARRINARNH